MDMQIRQFDQCDRVRRERENGNTNCEAVSMEKCARHWEPGKIPEHQPSEDEAD